MSQNENEAHKGTNRSPSLLLFIAYKERGRSHPAVRFRLLHRTGMFRPQRRKKTAAHEMVQSVNPNLGLMAETIIGLQFYLLFAY